MKVLIRQSRESAQAAAGGFLVALEGLYFGGSLAYFRMV
jgi:hypothetical protein